jgi:hypothetical protein
MLNGSLFNTAWRVLRLRKEAKRLLERPKRRWVDNSKMDLRDIRGDIIDWIDLAQHKDQYRALVNMVMNFWIPLYVGKFLSS